MATTADYRKKQAWLCVVVFVFLGLAALNFGWIATVAAVLAAAAVSLYAATLEPERAPEEHHHH